MTVTVNHSTYWTLARQLAAGKLICPETGYPLVLDAEGSSLITPDGARRYGIINGTVPVLIIDRGLATEYIRSSSRMVEEYRGENLADKETFAGRVKAFLTRDYRTKSSIDACNDIFNTQPEDAFCLSIGGGPGRPLPCLVNLNIGPFPNVDVVADAHRLPYADNSVDALYCEAVLEHLHDPLQSVREMQRVLKPQGLLYACTPFMQAYHGYPHHYQNFSLTGHCHLFTTAGFEILGSGVCVGPVYTMVSLTATFIHEFAPSLVCWPLQKAWGIFGAILRPLDRILNLRDNAFILASTTYLTARKK